MQAASKGMKRWSMCTSGSDRSYSGCGLDSAEDGFALEVDTVEQKEVVRGKNKGSDFRNHGGSRGVAGADSMEADGSGRGDAGMSGGAGEWHDKGFGHFPFQ